MLILSRKKNLNSQGEVILRNDVIQRVTIDYLLYGVTKTNFLGVIVVQHLNWEDYISMESHNFFKYVA